jgi:hypothetical protein
MAGKFAKAAQEADVTSEDGALRKENKLLKKKLKLLEKRLSTRPGQHWVGVEGRWLRQN